MKFNLLIILHLIVLHSSIAGMEVVSWLIFLVAAVAHLARREKSGLLGCDLWIAGFVAIAVAGLALSGASDFVFQIGFLRWIFLLYAFSYAWAKSGYLQKHDRLVWIWASLAAVAGLYAFFQFLTGINIFRPHHALSPTGGHFFRATGFFSGSLTLAYVLGISAAFLLPQLRNRRGFFVLLGCVALGMFGSLSRGSWISMSVVLFVFGLMEFRRKALWGLLPAAILFLLLFFFVPEFHYRITDLFTTTSGSSSGERLDIWSGYWRIFLDHPLLGSGLFNGDELLPEVYRRLGIEQPFVSHAHNNYLQVLAGTGIFGFICFVAFNFYFLRAAYVLYQKASRPELKRLAQGAFLAQVFWQLGGLTECNFFDGEVNHNIVFVWALVVALGRETKTSRPPG